MQQQLGHYQIKDLLGEGSFASVYRAFDQKFERYVALKILKPVWLSDPEAVGRFKREAKTMAQLRHPHIVDVYDVGEAEGCIYLAQLLVDGETLTDRLKRGPLKWTEMLEVLHSMASALDYAHGQGIVHRDVKPSNIMVARDGRAYLGDFGLVRAAEGSVVLSTSSGGMIGTPAYMAPEQWEGKGATAVTDVYALSCVVVEMLTGRVLFDGTTPATVMRQHLLEGPKFPDTWPADIPEQVSRVLRQGLAENPTERISSAGELFKAMETLSTLPAVEEEDKDSTLASVPTAEEVTPLWLISSVGQQYKLKPGRLTLGRSAACDIHFDDPQASRHHATLKFDGQRCIVYDENSANGTFINGKPVQTGGQPFEVEDRLRIGDTQFALRTAAPATSDVVKKKPKSAVKPSRPAPKRRSSSGLTAALVGCGVLLALIVCLGGAYAVSVNPSLLAFMITPTSTFTSTSTPTPTPESSSTHTPTTPTDTPTVTSTRRPPTSTKTATSTPAATPDKTATTAVGIAIEQTATADQSAKETATAQAAATQTAIAATQTAIAATQTAIAATQTAQALTATARRRMEQEVTITVPAPPTSIVVPFESPKGSSSLNPVFRWQGGDSADNDYKNDYKLIGNLELILISDANTGQWDKEDSAPLILYSIEGDFEAQVKMIFSESSGGEFAGLGIRSIQDRNTWVRIVTVFISGQDQIITLDVDRQGESSGREETSLYDKDKVYLKIQRHGQVFDFDYSEDGSKWVPLKKDYSIEMPSNVDIFLVASSWHDEGTQARFFDFTITK